MITQTIYAQVSKLTSLPVAMYAISQLNHSRNNQRHSSELLIRECCMTASHPTFLTANRLSRVVVPILAQRLLLNIRKADYVGRRPYASKLLFAPPPPGSQDNIDSFEMDPAQPVVESIPETRDPGPGA